MRKQALYYHPGSWNVDCDRCGLTFKSHELRLEWTGLRVCSCCFEERHPQDFIRGKKDDQAPPWTRPASEKTIVVTHLGEFVTHEGAVVTEGAADL